MKTLVVLTACAAVSAAMAQSAPPLIANIDVNYGYLKDKRIGHLGTTRSTQGTVSAQTQIERFSFGAGYTNGYAETDLKAHFDPTTNLDVPGGSTKAWSNTGFVRAGLQLDRISIGGFAGYGVTHLREFRDAGTNGPFTFERDADNWFWGAQIGTSFDLGSNFYLSPAAKILWSRTVAEAVGTIPKDKELLIRGQFGGEIGYQHAISETEILTPGIRAFFTHDFDPITDYTDRDSVDLTAFLTYGSPNLVLGVDVKTTVGHDDIEATTGRLFAAVKF